MFGQVDNSIWQMMYGGQVSTVPANALTDWSSDAFVTGDGDFLIYE